MKLQGAAVSEERVGAALGANAKSDGGGGAGGKWEVTRRPRRQQDNRAKHGKVLRARSELGHTQRHGQSASRVRLDSGSAALDMRPQKFTTCTRSVAGASSPLQRLKFVLLACLRTPTQSSTGSICIFSPVLALSLCSQVLRFVCLPPSPPLYSSAHSVSLPPVSHGHFRPR